MSLLAAALHRLVAKASAADPVGQTQVAAAIIAAAGFVTVRVEMIAAEV